VTGRPVSVDGRTTWRALRPPDDPAGGGSRNVRASSHAVGRAGVSYRQLLGWPFKSRPGRSDVIPMLLGPRDATWTRGGEPSLQEVTGVANFSQLSDDQLIIERDRQRRRLDELTVNPGSSPAVCSLLVSIDHDVERMTEELIRRARS